MKVFLVFLFLMLFAVNTVQAEQIKAKEVFITATKTEAELEDVPASVEIITKEEIEASGAEKLRDIIRFAENINFTRSMGRDLISIRGMNAEHTLVLIDGKRFAVEVGHPFELDRLTMENVERIEIIRGPVSSLYGSEALGGVINIITKRPDKFAFEFRPEYGAYQGGGGKQKSVSINYGAKHKNFGISLSGTLLNRDHVLTPRGTTYLNDEDRTNLSLKLYYDFSKHTTMAFDASYMTEDLIGRSLSGAALLKDFFKHRRYDLSLGLSHKSHELDYLIRAYTSIYDKDYELRGIAAGNLMRFDDIKRRTSVLEAKATKEIFKSHLFTIGGEFRREFFRGTRVKTGKGPFTITKEGITATGSEISLDYWAGYIQDEWQITDNLLLIPSVRYDDSDKFESEISPRVGITYKIMPNLRAKASYGHGFKSPTPRDLYIDMRHPGPRYIVMGNPDIKSEKSKTYELSVEGETGIFSGRIAYFFNDVKDLIESVQTACPSGTQEGWTCYSYQNIAKAEIQGIEASIKADLTEQFAVKGSYAYLDAEDKTKKESLTMRPKHKFISKVVYDSKSSGLKANLWGVWIIDNLWETTPSRKVKDYSLWYLSLSKNLTRNLELYAGIDNIFNKKDEDIPLVGSFYYGGVRVNF